MESLAEEGGLTGTPVPESERADWHERERADQKLRLQRAAGVSNRNGISEPGGICEVGFSNLSCFSQGFKKRSLKVLPSGMGNG